MPRKDRTPPPPKRRVQAPKARTTPREGRQTKVVLLAIAGSALVLIAVVAGFLLFSSGDSNAQSGDTLATLKDAGCTYKQYPSQGRGHVAALPKNFKANSVPRSSGPHSPATAVFGAYTDTIPELNAVHNLEHGGVIIWFGPEVPQSTIDQILNFYNEDPNGMIVAKHPKLGREIALVAWTRVARCPSFEKDAAEAFVKAFRGKGPERFSIEDLRPGGG